MGEDGELKVADGVARALRGESVKTTVTVSPLTFDIRYSPIVEPDGHISGITGVATDITDRKRAEDALRESEARNRALLAAMPDAMLTLTRAGIVTDYKPTETLQPTIPREEIIGYPLSKVIPAGRPGRTNHGRGDRLPGQRHTPHDRNHAPAYNTDNACLF